MRVQERLGQTPACSEPKRRSGRRRPRGEACHERRSAHKLQDEYPTIRPVDRGARSAPVAQRNGPCSPNRTPSSPPERRRVRPPRDRGPCEAPVSCGSYQLSPEFALDNFDGRLDDTEPPGERALRLRPRPFSLRARAPLSKRCHMTRRFTFRARRSALPCER